MRGELDDHGSFGRERKLFLDLRDMPVFRHAVGPDAFVALAKQVVDFRLPACAGHAAEGIGDLALIQNLIFSNVVISGGPVPGGINVGDNDSPSRLPSGTLFIISNTVVGNQADRGAAEICRSA